MHFGTFRLKFSLPLPNRSQKVNICGSALKVSTMSRTFRGVFPLNLTVSLRLHGIFRFIALC